MTTVAPRNHLNYRETLLEEFARRQLRNRSYSLRAFARDLALQPSKLSEILGGKRGLSPARAEILADKIGLSPRQKHLFLLQVEAEHGRSQLSRRRALGALEDEGWQAVRLDQEKFKVISRWHHFAILETVQLPGFQDSIPWLAARLSITEPEAMAAVERLVDIGLLERSEDGLRRTQRDLATTDDIPSRSIRDHHLEVMKLAEAALEKNLPVEAREFQTLMLAFAYEDVAEAKAMIRDFMETFVRRFQGHRVPDSVYGCALQFFQIDQKGENS